MSELITVEAASLRHGLVDRVAPILGGLVLEPTGPDYALLPIDEAYDWKSFLAAARRARERTRPLPETPLFAAAFLSLHKPEADTVAIGRHDHNAHMAAIKSDSLIHYEPGTPNPARIALSVCVWDDPTIAKVLTASPEHRAAMAMISEYAGFQLSTYDIHHLEDPLRFKLTYRREEGVPIT